VNERYREKLKHTNTFSQILRFPGRTPQIIALACISELVFWTMNNGVFWPRASIADASYCMLHDYSPDVLVV
jgi:hypothetical protein